jgi:hypothetical protein
MKMDSCCHEIVEDYIDMDLDTTRQIFYCTKCEKTCSHKEYISFLLVQTEAAQLDSRTADGASASGCVSASGLQ